MSNALPPPLPPTPLPAPAPPPVAPAVLGYALAPPLYGPLHVQITDTPQELIVTDMPMPLWRILLSFALAVGWTLLPMTCVFAFIGLGGVGWAIILVATATGLFFLMMGIDGIAKRISPAVITVRDGFLRVASASWRGFRVRQEPLASIRQIDIALGSAAVHAWNGLVIRLHDGRRFSVLSCPHKPDIQLVAHVLQLRLWPSVARRLSGEQNAG